MLHKAADCDAYWQARDPTDLKLHTEDAVYFVLDGEQPQEGDCKHDTQPQPTHLTLRGDRVERVAQQKVTYHDEYETRLRREAELTGVDQHNKNELLTQVRQEEQGDICQIGKQIGARNPEGTPDASRRGTGGESMAHMSLHGNSDVGKVAKGKDENTTDNKRKEQETKLEAQKKTKDEGKGTREAKRHEDSKIN